MSDKSTKAFSLPVLVDRLKSTVDGVGHSLLGPDFEGFVDQEIRDVTAQMKLAKERREEAKANRLSATTKLAHIKDHLKEQEEQALKLLKLKLGAYKASANLQRTQASLLRQPGAAPAMPETALKSAQRLRQTTAPSPAPEPEPSRPATETTDQVLQRLEAILKKPARSSRKSASGKSA